MKFKIPKDWTIKKGKNVYYGIDFAMGFNAKEKTSRLIRNEILSMRDGKGIYTNGKYSSFIDLKKSRAGCLFVALLKHKQHIIELDNLHRRLQVSYLVQAQVAINVLKKASKQIGVTAKEASHKFQEFNKLTQSAHNKLHKG